MKASRIGMMNVAIGARWATLGRRATTSSTTTNNNNTVNQKKLEERGRKSNHSVNHQSAAADVLSVIDYASGSGKLVYRESVPGRDNSVSQICAAEGDNGVVTSENQICAAEGDNGVVTSENQICAAEGDNGVVTSENQICAAVE